MSVHQLPLERPTVRVGGRPVTTGREVKVVNPYTGEAITSVPLCGPADVEAACAAAAAALERDDFRQHRRAEVLERARRLLDERREAFARTMALECGKPIRTARGEVARCLDTLAYAAVEARTLSGEMVPVEGSEAGAGKIGFALRVPIGVVAAITPFNFPLNLVAHKVAPAIAAGCPVVLKPAPQAPLSALALVDLLVEAGLPEDWVSVVTDAGREAGEPLVAHPVPALVSFTGSVPVGWSIAAAAPRKRVALELGSNAPVIVARDADLGELVPKLVPGAFANAGQSCISVQRVLVHRDLHAPLLAELEEAAAALVVGDPLDEATDLGPLISSSEAERVVRWIGEAVAAGGQLVTGGRRQGAAVTPAVVDRPPLGSDLCAREVFGPVVAVLPFDDFDAGLEVANATDFPLQAGVFTNELALALRAVRRLRFGGVLINDVPTVRADQQPYGGEHDAGNTREGPRYAIHEMTQLRYVSLPVWSHPLQMAEVGE